MGDKIIFEDLTKKDEDKKINSEDIKASDINSLKTTYTEEEIEKLVKSLAGTVSSQATRVGYLSYMKIEEIILSIFTSAYDLVNLYSSTLKVIKEEKINEIINTAKKYSTEYVEQLKKSGKVDELKQVFDRIEAIKKQYSVK